MMTRKPIKPLFLCGMMGSGKTTVGKILAGKLDLPFSDLDKEIEKKAGITIPEIFRIEGERKFRIYEKDALTRIAAGRGGVVALGGGALQNQEIVDHLKINGWLIFLDAPLSVLLERLKNDFGRPLLQQTDGTETQTKIAELLKKRLKYYTQSHIRIKTRWNSPESIADEIIKKITTHES